MNNDDDTARLIFETQETASQRRKDVRSTERYATDIAHYNPLDNDWPRVDDRGALPNVKDWEENDEFGEFGLRVDPRSDAAARGVIGYVNWYGDTAGTRAISNEKEFTWTYSRRTDPEDGMPIVVMRRGSRVYRGTVPAEFDARLFENWYSTRNVARMYTDAGHKTGVVKHIEPYVLKQDLVLVDMTKIDAVHEIIKDANDADEHDVVKAMQNMFYIHAINKRTGENAGVKIDPNVEEYPRKCIVVRHSTIEDDDIFCRWFDHTYFHFDGWCFLKSVTKVDVREIQSHHDEIYLLDPDEVLTRLRYAIKEVNWAGKDVAVIPDEPVYEVV